MIKESNLPTTAPVDLAELFDNWPDEVWILEDASDWATWNDADDGTEWLAIFPSKYEAERLSMLELDWVGMLPALVSFDEARGIAQLPDPNDGLGMFSDPGEYRRHYTR